MINLCFKKSCSISFWVDLCHPSLSVPYLQFPEMLCLTNYNVMSNFVKLTKHSKTSFEKNCFSAWASTLNMGLINKVDMVCLSPVGYGV